MIDRPLGLLRAIAGPDATFRAGQREAIDAVVAERRSARGPMALSNRNFVRFLLVDCTPRPCHDVDSCRFRSDVTPVLS